MFPPYVSGVLETPYGDDEDSNDDDDEVPIPRIRDLSFFPPSAFGASQANSDDDGDVENEGMMGYQSR